MNTPRWLWVVLASPIPPAWYAVTHSGNGVDDRAFFWVGIAAVLPMTLYSLHWLIGLVTLAVQRRWMLPDREAS